MYDRRREATRKMADYDFSDAALMGHVVSISLLTKLLQKGIISPAEAADLLDDALLRLEEWQAKFPDHQPYFEIARATLSEFVDAVRPTTKKPRE
jgi:hypothetical protein